MIVELPDAELANLGLTNAQARIEVAVGLYSGRQVTMGRASRIAGLSQAAFMQELGRRGISLNYTEEDAQHDVAAVRRRLGQ
jgi:predicted HTH domain antitoxin